MNSGIENSYATKHFIVHPGYAENHDGWHANKFIMMKKYPAHLEDLSLEIGQALRNDEPLYILYGEGELEATEEFLEENRLLPSLDHVTDALETTVEDGKMVVSRPEKLESIVESAEGHLEAVVHGELDGRCRTDFKDGIEALSDQKDGELRVVDGEVFPYKPLPRKSGSPTV